MLTHDDVSVLLGLLSQVIELEGIQREQDKTRSNGQFYQLVDLRNKVLAGFWPICGSAGFPVLSRELTRRLGRCPGAIELN